MTNMRFPFGKSRSNTALTNIDSRINPVLHIGRPRGMTGPVVFAAPHSGRCYPSAWIRGCRLSAAQLRSVEDAYVDQIFASVTQYGAPLLRARFARSFVDVNRARHDLSLSQRGSSGPESMRARAGLGVVPLAIGADRPIYKVEPTQDAITHRLAHYYDAYHAALDDLMDEAVSMHGHALLIDCHSMPGEGPMKTRRPDIVLGDRYGVSCDISVLRFAADTLRAMGYKVAINHPYAGGYITQRHGRPSEGRQALQIEISRTLYMNGVTLRKISGFEALSQNMEKFARAMMNQFGQSAGLVAAE